MQQTQENQSYGGGHGNSRGRGAKEVVVDGKEAKMQTAMLNATTVVKWIIWLKIAIKSRMTS